MASGPLFPFSSWPDSNGKMYPGIHKGSSASRIDVGMNVIASLDADSVWSLRFRVPETLPSGSLFLDLLALANATSGSAQMNPSYAPISASANPDTASLTAKGVTTIGWGTGDADSYKETKIRLDVASSPAANDIIVMMITAASSSWNLAQISTWQASLIWE